MKFAILSFGLIFAFHSQASFLSRVLYNSEIFKSFCWSISDVPLSLYHDTVGISSTTNSTSADEGDDLQVESESDQIPEITETSPTNTSNEAFQERVMSISQGCMDLPPSSHSKKLQTFKSKRGTHILRDSTDGVEDVQPMNTGTQSREISHSQLVPSVDNRSKTLIVQGKCEEIVELNESMNDEEFLKQLCPVVKTLEQYNGIVNHLKQRKLVASFYVHGDIGVVEEVIIAESKVCDYRHYIEKGNTETALHLALKEDCHDRFIDLLKAKQGAMAIEDEQFKQNGMRILFEHFVGVFLSYLAPWEDGMALKRFLIFYGDTLRDENSDIIDILLEKLTSHLSKRPDDPKFKKFLIDLMGQPSLLTSVSFAQGFLCYGYGERRSEFIKYAWNEAIQEGLKEKGYLFGGELLWRVMKGEYPDQAFGDYPPTVDTLAPVLKQFPTKKHLEWQWIRDNAPGFLETINQVFDGILPIVLISIVIEYGRPTWIDVPSIKS